MKRYTASDAINRLLECPKCNEAGRDMKVLPCGESICEICLDDQVFKSKEAKSKSIECFLCNKAHVVPEEGFITNEGLKKLAKLELEATEISRGEEANELISILNGIRTTRVEIEQLAQKPENVIDDKCRDLTNEVEVDVAVETVHKRLDEMRERVLEEINAYKTERLKELLEEDKFVNWRHELSRLLEKTTEFEKKWNDYLGEATLDKKRLDEAIKSAQSLNDKLRREEERARRNALGGQVEIRTEEASAKLTTSSERLVESISFHHVKECVIQLHIGNATKFSKKQYRRVSNKYVMNHMRWKIDAELRKNKDKKDCLALYLSCLDAPTTPVSVVIEHRLLHTTDAKLDFVRVWCVQSATLLVV